MMKTIQFISQVKTFPLNLQIHLHEMTDLFSPLFSKSLPLQTATILNWWYMYTLCHNIALQSRISHHYRSFLSCFRTHTQAVFCFLFFCIRLLSVRKHQERQHLDVFLWKPGLLRYSCVCRVTHGKDHTLAFCAKTQFLRVVISLHIKFSNYSLISLGHIATPHRRCAGDTAW